MGSARYGDHLPRSPAAVLDDALLPSALIQCDHGAIKPAQKLTRPHLLKWVREQVAAGHAVHTVYEACGFGYWKAARPQ